MFKIKSFVLPPGPRFEEEDLYTPPFKRMNLLTRHYNEEGRWLWTGYFLKSVLYTKIDVNDHCYDSSVLVMTY